MVLARSLYKDTESRQRHIAESVCSLNFALIFTPSIYLLPYLAPYTEMKIRGAVLLWVLSLVHFAHSLLSLCDAITKGQKAVALLSDSGTQQSAFDEDIPIDNFWL